MTHPNYPFDEIARACEEHVKNGSTIYQKFTCAKCGARQTMDVPNTLYTYGQCEECEHITDIKKDGCNYVLISSGKSAIKTLVEMLRQESKR